MVTEHRYTMEIEQRMRWGPFKWHGDVTWQRRGDEMQRRLGLDGWSYGLQPDRGWESWSRRGLERKMRRWIERERKRQERMETAVSEEIVA